MESVTNLEMNDTESPKREIHVSTYRDAGTSDYKKFVSRLNKIEGQIRGIKGMFEDGRSIHEIIVQVNAAQAALGSFNKVLLIENIHECMNELNKNSGEDYEKSVAAFARMIQKIIEE